LLGWTWWLADGGEDKDGESLFVRFGVSPLSLCDEKVRMGYARLIHYYSKGILIFISTKGATTTHSVDPVRPDAAFVYVHITDHRVLCTTIEIAISDMLACAKDALLAPLPPKSLHPDPRLPCFEPSTVSRGRKKVYRLAFAHDHFRSP